MARFTDDQLRRFLLGEEIPCPSWITFARYDEDAQTLYLGMKGCPAGGWPWTGVDTDMAWSFAVAKSKGTWLHANLPINGRDPRG